VTLKLILRIILFCKTGDSKSLVSNSEQKDEMYTTNIERVTVMKDGEERIIEARMSHGLDTSILVTEPIKMLRTLLPSKFKMLAMRCKHDLSEYPPFKYVHAQRCSHCHPRQNVLEHIQESESLDDMYVVVTITLPRSYSDEEVSQMKTRLGEFRVYQTATPNISGSYNMIYSRPSDEKWVYFCRLEYHEYRKYIVKYLNNYADVTDGDGNKKLREIDIDYLVFLAKQNGSPNSHLVDKYKSSNCDEESIKTLMKSLISKDVYSRTSQVISSPYKTIIGECDVVNLDDTVDLIYDSLINNNITNSLLKVKKLISSHNDQTIYETTETGKNKVNIIVFSNDIMKFPYTLADFIHKWE